MSDASTVTFVATVEISLVCLLPRPLLASDPHVVINESPPTRLTKQAIRFDVDAAEIDVVVMPFADSDPTRSRRKRLTAFTRRKFAIDADEHLALGFHPALFNGSYMFRGHLWRRRRT